MFILLRGASAKQCVIASRWLQRAEGDITSVERCKEVLRGEIAGQTRLIGGMCGFDRSRGRQLPASPKRRGKSTYFIAELLLRFVIYIPVDTLV